MTYINDQEDISGIIFRVYAFEVPPHRLLVTFQAASWLIFNGEQVSAFYNSCKKFDRW